MKCLAFLLTLAITLQLCAAADAQRGGRGGGGGMRGGGTRGAGMSRPSGGGMSRPSGGGGRGYNLGGSDFSRGGFGGAGGPGGSLQRPGVAQRPGGVGGVGGAGRPGGPGGVGGVGGAGRPGGPGGPGGPGRPGSAGNRPGGGSNIGNGNTIINNPTFVGGGYYGWNGGMPWYPAPYYWGGGFWGAMAIGVTSAAVYGAIVDEGTDVTYNSYEVQPGTAGATFLSSYQLTQTQCGPQGLVVVYGPENSVVCAQPNQNVGEGSYRLDTVTLDLIPVKNGPPQPAATTPPS